MRLQGRVAIVTGGASGIGAAIAGRFASEGSKVVIADVNASLGEDSARRLGHPASAVQVDVGSKDSIQAMVDKVEQTVGPIDILVNNAAVFGLQPLLEVDERSFDRLFSINVRGHFFVLQAVARSMVSSGRRGVIVNIASQAGRRGEAHSAIYAATKAAVISLTQSAALALIGNGIRVNALAPGVVDTPMWDQVDALYAEAEGLPAGEKRRRVGQAVPYGRMGSADEIARAALFLASDDAEYVVGQTINVDGGNVLS